MTLQELVISLRYRLQDIYTSDGTLISTYNADGQRWSSALLLDVIHKGLLQYTQLTNLLQKFNPDQQIYQLDVVIQKSIQIVNGSAPLNFPFTEISSLVVANSTKESPEANEFDLYAYVSPKKYYIYSASKGESVNKKAVYTVATSDTTPSTTQLLVLPLRSGTYQAKMIITKSLDRSDLSTGSLLIPTKGALELFLLDCCEYQARVYEGYQERANTILQNLYTMAGITTKGSEQ